MDRLGRFRSIVAVTLIGGGLLAVAAGCNAVATAWWVIKDGKTYPAEYKGLNGKKVAVIVRGPQSGMFRQAQNMPYQLTRNINRLLKANLSKKTQIISADRIDTALDNQDWTDFVEVGKQLNAEQVVAIEVAEFNQSLLSTAFKGDASLSISVFDVEKDGEEVYGPKSLRDIRFPPTTEAMPAGNMSRGQFTELFVTFLADHIARNFYDHDPRANFAGYGMVE
jgi:hypothetical protein